MGDANKVCKHPYRISFIEYAVNPIGICYTVHIAIILLVMGIATLYSIHYGTPICTALIECGGTLGVFIAMFVLMSISMYYSTRDAIIIEERQSWCRSTVQIVSRDKE